MFAGMARSYRQIRYTWGMSGPCPRCESRIVASTRHATPPAEPARPALRVRLEQCSYIQCRQKNLEPLQDPLFFQGFQWPSTVAAFFVQNQRACKKRLKFGVSRSSHRHDGGGGLVALLFFECRFQAFFPKQAVSPGFPGVALGWNFRHVGFHQSQIRTWLKNNRSPNRTCPAVTGAFFRHGVSCSRSFICSLQ